MSTKGGDVRKNGHAIVEFYLGYRPCVKTSSLTSFLKRVSRGMTSMTSTTIKSYTDFEQIELLPEPCLVVLHDSHVIIIRFRTSIQAKTT